MINARLSMTCEQPDPVRRSVGRGLPRDASLPRSARRSLRSWPNWFILHIFDGNKPWSEGETVWTEATATAKDG
jgi:hypothetical protein